MISWIQRTFQHHFRIIFGLLLAVVIVAFIFTIGSTPGLGTGDRQAVDERQFFGVGLNSGTMRRAMNDAALSVSLQVGFMALDSEALQKYTLQRMTALHLADQYHIPGPTTAEMTAQIKSLRAFTGVDGSFDAARYNTFRDSLKTSSGTTEDEVSRVLADDFRAARVQDLLAGPGYVLPSDIKTQLAEADTTWTIGLATADYAAYAPEIRPTDADLTKFYQENTFRYDIPPRVVASYLDFPAANFVSRVTVTEAEARQFYESNPARFPKPAVPGAPAPAAAPSLLGADKDAKTDVAADFLLVRPQVEAELRLEKARRMAQQAAADAAFKLFDGKVNPQTLPGFVAANQYVLKDLAPFTREDGPAELGKSPEISSAAFGLGANRVFSDALVSPQGAVVLVWKETQSVRTPPYAEVRERVAADYAETEKRKRFVELGRTTRTALESRLKAGDDLQKAAAAASAGGLKLEARTVAPFTRRNPPADLPGAVIISLDQIEKGQVSEMIVASEKGHFVHVADKKLPDLSETSESFGSMRTQVANAISRYSAQSVIQGLMEAELKRTEPVAQ